MPAESFLPGQEGDRQVLVVDDSCIQARLFMVRATALNLRVQSVADYEQAAAWLAHNSPAMVFIELHLLADNGFALGRTIMTAHAVPCALMTGLLKATDREWALRLGFSAVLERPLRPEDLRRVLPESE